MPSARPSPLFSSASPSETSCAAFRGWIAFVALWSVAGLFSLGAAPHLWRAYHHPLTWIAPVVVLAALVAVPFLAKAGRARAALLASSAAIVALWGIVGQGLYPHIVPALDDPSKGLTIAHAAASPTVLTSLLVILLLALTLVAGYSAFVFLRFRRSDA